MNKRTKQSSVAKGFVIFLTILLSTSSILGYMNKEIELTVNTDQTQYYPLEEVTVFGQLKENGTGVPSSIVCISAYDPNQTMVFGFCSITNPDGTYSLSHVLENSSIIGVYNVEVHSVEFDIYTYTTFEVVSTTILVDAHGPYEGTVTEPVSFYGNVTGGKLPYAWHWDFGDGNNSNQQNPDHTYTNVGNYTATLTVTDNEGYTGVDTADVTISPLGNSAPDNPTIDGMTSGKAGETYEYTFITTDPENDDVYYYVEWGDGEATDWIGLYASGEEIKVSHTWDEQGTYIIKAKAKDMYDSESDWSTLEITMPYVHFFERTGHPILQFLFDLFYSLFRSFAL